MVQENKRHKILFDFKIQTKHLISAKQQELVIIKKKFQKNENLQNWELCVPAYHRVKLKESQE